MSQTRALLFTAALGVGGYILYQRLNPKPVGLQQHEAWISEHTEQSRIAMLAGSRSDGTDASFDREYRKALDENADRLRQLALSRSNGTNEDYGVKLNEVYNEVYGRGKW